MIGMALGALIGMGGAWLATRRSLWRGGLGRVRHAIIYAVLGGYLGGGSQALLMELEGHPLVTICGWLLGVGP